MGPIVLGGRRSGGSAWNADVAAASPHQDDITLIEGTSFFVSGHDGDVRPRRPHGLFFDDTRILSGWLTRVNGFPIEPLSASVESGHGARMVGLVRTDRSSAIDGSVVVARRRTLTTALSEQMTLRNFSRQDVEITIEMRFEADFADVFDVKSSALRSPRRSRRFRSADRLVFEVGRGAARRGVVLHTGGGAVRGSRVVRRVTVPAHGSWSGSLHIVPTVVGQESSMELPNLKEWIEEVERVPIEWHARTPRTVTENDAISAALQRGQDDIEALRIVDPVRPHRTVIAAGAPWYMALFGRDSIITSIMTLPMDADIALGTLRSLGERQGRTVDPITEEEPGRILHEVRLGAAVDSTLRGKDTYFGTVDATPLYVVAVEELTRWGLSAAHANELIGHADRCLGWIEDYGDRDGDGFVEYKRASSHGLVNQGWKDSWDAIRFSDGRVATAPIALCEVQGYVYAAYRARARLARDRGDAEGAAKLDDKAARLKHAFNERFWLADPGYFALALDENKEPVDACASNMGHCLWSGIIDDDKARSVADRLLAPDMFSGWGIRTLSTEMTAFDPVSYHNGSVWPHDNALIVAGLMRYGFVDKAQRVAMALFDAAAHFDGRLPELFCGFAREDHQRPVPYPNACAPQAWAAATPFSLIRTLLRLDVDVTRRLIRIDPALPAELGAVRIENLLIGDARVSVDVDPAGVRVSGLPESYTVERAQASGGGDRVP